MNEAQAALQDLEADESAAANLHEDAGSELVADKGYHGNDSLLALQADGIRPYFSEPDRGRRKWQDKPEANAATYANRRRIRGDRGKRLLRKRGELLERPFAHYLEAGGMRRTHLRHHDNILKRLLVHVAGFNLGILMRSLFGAGTPKEHSEFHGRLCRLFQRLIYVLIGQLRPDHRSVGEVAHSSVINGGKHSIPVICALLARREQVTAFSPGC